MNAAPTLPRTIWLLATLRLRTQINRISVLTKVGAKHSAKRGATPAKRRGGLVATLAILAILLFNSFNLSTMAVGRLHDRFGAAFGIWSHPAGMVLTLLSIVLVLLPFTVIRQLGQSDWELEWLSTLPVSRAKLLWCRLLERGLLHFGGLFIVWPFCTVLAWSAGWHGYAPLIGLAVCLPVFVLAAAVSIAMEAGLKMLLPATALRNLHAMISMVSIGTLYLAMSFGMPHTAEFVMNWAGNWPQWAAWLPTGLMVRLLVPGQPHVALLALTYLAETAVVICLFMGVLLFLVRHGVVRGGEIESKGRKATVRTPPFWSGWSLPLSTLQRRELRLLARDRNFMMQALFMPLIVIGGQMLFTGGLSHLRSMLSDPHYLPSAAFTVGAYVLLTSAFQALNHEGQALWLLFTFPRSLEHILQEKVRMWAAIAMAYPITILLFGYAQVATVDYHLIVSSLMAVAGIPIYASIAVSLGALASDPTAPHAQQRTRPAWLYLYMLLMALYGFAVYQNDALHKLVLLMLSLGLAIALWQKVRDELPFLLDSAAAPPAQVSSADGLMAAMLFFVLQVAVNSLMRAVDDRHPSTDIVVAFSAAGLLTFAMVRYTYWRTGTAGVPALLGKPLAPSLRLGAAGGAAASVVGLLWLAAVGHFHLWSTELAHASLELSPLAVLLLGVFVAPPCEEFIFRGLIFGGLRRTYSLPRSMLLSAALFAIVHPVWSMVPVFVVGLCAAYAFERSKSLVAPILVHAIYNGVVLGYQILSM